MAVIEIFRTIPGPKQSWRPLTVRIDDSRRAHVPGAGYVPIEVGLGTHRLGIDGTLHPGQSIDVTVVGDRPTQVLVGPGAGGISADGHRVDIRECSDREELPRCLIPLHDPGGLPQTLTRGRNKAWLAFVLMLGTGLSLCVLGTYFLTNAKVVVQYPAGFVIMAIGAWIVWKLRIVWWSIWNQRDWPMEDWRVNDNVGGSEEWKRWSSSSPDNSMDSSS